MLILVLLFNTTFSLETSDNNGRQNSLTTQLLVINNYTCNYVSTQK